MVNLGLKLSTEKMHNPEVENYILFGGLDGPQAQEPACQVVLRDCSKGVREEPGFRGVFATKTR